MRTPTDLSRTLRIVITNDGAEPTDRDHRTAAGHGLIGMRERLADLQGDVETNLDQGRFTLRASVLS
ncbi:MAG: hypothetical protein QM650_14710 [Microlunatus sp.]